MAEVQLCDVHWSPGELHIAYASPLADTCMSSLPASAHGTQPTQAPCIV